MKRIYLVRHGETAANDINFVPSKLEPLNDTGFHQANELADRVSNLDVEKLVMTEYLRTQQTMQPIEEQKKMKAEIMPIFGEMFEATSLHGLLQDGEVVQSNRKIRNKNITNTEYRFEDGDTYFDLMGRINQGKKYLETMQAESVLVVSHSFYLQMFVSAILMDISEPSEEWFRMGLRLGMGNTGISFLTYKNNRWTVVMHNDHAHFAE